MWIHHTYCILTSNVISLEDHDINTNCFCNTFVHIPVRMTFKTHLFNNELNIKKKYKKFHNWTQFLNLFHFSIVLIDLFINLFPLIKILFHLFLILFPFIKFWLTLHLSSLFYKNQRIYNIV